MQNSKPAFFSRLINGRYKLLFWIFFVTAFLAGYLQVLQNKKLINETAHHGIMTLEVGKSFSVDSSIVSSWKKIIIEDSTRINDCNPPTSVNLLHLAKRTIYIDFAFIIFYTCLAIVIILWLQQGAGVKNTIYTNVLIILALLMGVMDVIENIGMLRFIRYGMDGQPVPGNGVAVITGIASRIKFGILIGLGLLYLPYMLIVKNNGLKAISDTLKQKMEQVFRYRVIFIGLVGFAAPMWILDQGQDLLVNSNAEESGVLLFLATVVIIAFLNWYLSKLFFRKEYKQGVDRVYPFSEPVLEDPVQQAAEKKVSRFLGVAAIVLPAAAILNALQLTHIRYRLDIFPPSSSLLGLLAIFFVLIKYDLAGRAFQAIANRPNGKIKANIIGVTMIILLAFVIPLVIRVWIGKGSHRPTSLIYLYWHLVLLSFAFYIFVSIRGCIFSGDGWMSKKIGIPVFIMALVACVAFVWVNAWPLAFQNSPFHFITLPLLICGAVFYIFLFTLLIRLSQRLKINFVAFIIVIGLVLSISNANNYHSVATHDSAPAASKPLDLGTYFKKWVLQRKEEIANADSAHPYPIFLVNTYGGGIRASAFTSMVISFLDSALLEEGKQAFDHYTFSISGASGGTIGAAVNCAYRHRYLDKADAYKLDSFINFYQHDFLTPVLVTDLGRDIWASASTLSWWNDRAAVQEKAWQDFSHHYLHMDLDMDYDALWDTANSRTRYEVPLLFSNTLNVDDGLKGICAPVYLSKDDFPATIFIRNRLDYMNKNRKAEDSMQSISFITGAFLSARFPFISPSGKMGAGYHFMDGGGKDNSGAFTSDQVFSALARYSEKESVLPNTSADDSLFESLVKNIRFYFVSIRNSPYHGEGRKLVENRFELISPLVGIINSGIDGNAHAADNTLRTRYSDTLKHQGFYTNYFSVFPTVECVKDDSKHTYVPILPLGWQISEPALQRLKPNLDSPDPGVTNGLNGVLEVMRHVRTVSGQ
jgi:hypothetical protein